MLLMLVVGLLAGCRSAHEAPEATAPGGAEAIQAADPTLPTTYTGMIPCADCPGIRLTIKLRPDSLYLLRRTYLEVEDGRDRSFYALGSWRLADSTLYLYGGGERPRLFRFSAGSLEMLDREGNPAASELNYTLTRADTAVALEGPFRLTGLFSYMADAARFDLCGSERTFPVAMEGAYLQLERVYLEVQNEPNEKVLARIRGHLARRPGMEGREEEMIVVDSLIELVPGSPCPPANAPLW